MAEKEGPQLRPRNSASCCDAYILGKGFDGSSLADLTTAMGINAPSLYAAFGSKEELYLQALTLYAGEIGVEIWSTLDETADVRAAFERFLLATIDAYCEESVPRGCMIALDALHRTQSSDKVCGVLRNRRQTNIETLKKRLERGIRDGDIAASVNCGAVATFMRQSRTACPFSRAMAERAKTLQQRHWAPWLPGRNWFSPTHNQATSLNLGVSSRYSATSDATSALAMMRRCPRPSAQCTLT